MKYYETNTYEEDTKIINARIQYRIKCKNCGHSILMMKKDREICGWCYRWVYKNPKSEFKYKLLENKERNKRNEQFKNSIR